MDERVFEKLPARVDNDQKHKHGSEIEIWSKTRLERVFSDTQVLGNAYNRTKHRPQIHL